MTIVHTIQFYHTHTIPIYQYNVSLVLVNNSLWTESPTGYEIGIIIVEKVTCGHTGKDCWLHGCVEVLQGKVSRLLCLILLVWALLTSLAQLSLPSPESMSNNFPLALLFWSSTVLCTELTWHVAWHMLNCLSNYRWARKGQGNSEHPEILRSH